MNQNLPILSWLPDEELQVNPSGALQKQVSLMEHLAPVVADGALVAFSGGIDSAFLLWAATRVGEERGGRVVALTTTSPSTPTRDKKDAEAFSSLLGVQHLWEESGEVDLSEYALNDRDRCYHCKTELFRIAGRIAGGAGLPWLLYGYNASDPHDDRPGHRAAKEAGVLTPLLDAGLSKGEIRFLMRNAELPLSEKPSSPCLSSRITTGIGITPAVLRDVEDMEEILRGVGVATLRVRVCRDHRGSPFLRVEVPPDEMTAALACRKELLTVARERGYRWVTLDLDGYRTGGGVA